MPDFSWVAQDDVSGNSEPMVLSDSVPVVIPIAGKECEQYIFLQNIADSVSAVMLETTDESLIGQIEKLQVFNDTIYILDRRKHPGLYIFDLSGRYLGRVGSVGQGPQEYNEPTDFDVSSDSIYILDQYKARLHVFDKSLSHRSVHKLPFIATGISAINDSTFCFNHVDADNIHLGQLIDYAVYMTGSDFNIKRFGFRREHGKYVSLWVPSDFYRSGNLTYYHPPMSNDIFTIDSLGEIRHAYHIDAGSYQMPSEYALKEKESDYQHAADSDDYYDFRGHFYSDGTWSYFNFAQAHWLKHVLASTDGKVYIGQFIADDLMYNLPVGDVYGLHDGMLITVLDPETIVKGFERGNREEVREHLGAKGFEICERLEADDNPVLFFIKLKPTEASADK